MSGGRAITLLVVLSLLAGCGKPAAPTPVEVAGKVLDASGKPLGNVLVRFNGQEKAQKGFEIVSFPTKEDGSFSGKCLPGKWRVTLLPVPIQQGGAPGKGAPAPAGKVGSEKIPKQYTSATESPWMVEVPAGGKTDFEFKLE